MFIRKLLIVLLLFVLAEVGLIVYISSLIGFFWTFLFLVAAGVLGALTVASFGQTILRRIKAALADGRLPSASLIDGACLILSGCLLVFPGFISDLLAFVVILPWFRQRINRWIRSWLKNHWTGSGFSFYSFGRRR